MYSNYYYDNFDYTSIISSLMGVFIFVGIISTAIMVLSIVALWKMFEKAGEPGWAALIPFYNSYVLFKISWGNGWYFLLSVLPAIIYEVVYISFYAGIVGGIMSNAMDNSFNDAYAASIVSSSIGIGLLLFLLSLGMLAVNIISCIKLAKVFGQGGGFACGLFFLQIIFYCIIAFSKDIHYVGIAGKIPPYGAGGGRPVQPGYQPNGYQNPYYQQQGYQNPYYQSNGYQQQGYQSPYYQPNGYQQGYQNPYNQQNSYRPVNPQPVAQPPEDLNQQAAAPSINMFCSECGTRLENNEKVCPKCGKVL